VREDASVVLVGDPFQLTAIEAGTVLSDIVGPAADGDLEARSAAPIGEAVVVLDRVHRFEEQGAISDFAAAVRSGDADAAIEVLAVGSESVRWIEDRASAGFAALWEHVVEQRAALVRVAANRGSEAEALDRLGELAILCAHRQGPASVARWQRDLETALDDRFPGLRYHGEWYPGRPVMITSNDYNLNLFNGDIGVAVATDDGLRVVFDRGGLSTFQPSHLGERATVHALTIHKSQGSQFEEVVVVLPQETSRLLTRELLYTAVTRASTRVTLIGSESVVRQAVERSVQRASGLGLTLWGLSGA
jgi:exodeoxyribonuclease V alpha subunit